MSALRARVRRTIQRHGLCPSGTRLLIALSGGSDSVALLWLMHELSRDGAFQIAGIAHLNHELRPAALRDEAFCRGVAARIGIPIDVGTADVRARARDDGLSIEDAARRERYAFLLAAADRAGADRIAVGHTRDDQTETFLLKLARGAGLAGLGGIYPARGRLVRPLIDATHVELRAYLGGLGERWIEDETNADTSNPRNLVRHVLLPQFDAAFGTSIRDAIARAAALAGADGRLLDEMAADRYRDLAVGGAAGLEFNRARLSALPQSLLRRVLLRAMRARAERREVGLPHVDAASDVLAGRAVSADAPGGRWELLGENLVLLSTRHPTEAFHYPLHVPGQVLVPEAEGAIVAEQVRASERTSQVDPGGRGGAALVSRTGLERLIVRSRRPGDRLRLAGRSGQRKLQDVFVDAKVPRWTRDRIPLVVDVDDRIVWIPGHGVSEDFRVSEGEDAVILLTFIRMGEKA